MDTEVIASSDEFAASRRVGAMLAAARTSARLDLVDIARDTRVPLRHLVAIEADAHDSLPALPYAIGFVKAFARAVGVDAEAAGAQFRAETSKTAHVPAPAPMAPPDERRLPPRGLLTVSVVVVLAAIAGVVAWSAGAFDTTETPPAVAVTAPPPAAAPVATVDATTGTGAPPVIADALPPAPTSEAALVTGPPTATAGQLVPPAAAPPTAAGRVVITATEDAWFRVSLWDPGANKVVAVKSGVLAKGERYTVPPTAGLRLWTGRAGALRISVDGRTLPPLGGPVETVKNVDLGADALRARLALATPGVAR